MSAVKPRSNIDCLDAFRAVAILLVFVYHYAIEVYGLNQYANRWEGFWRSFPLTHNRFANAIFYPITIGWAGVSLFFVLSGFLIHYSFETSRLTWGAYFRRRFWRIYPAYIIALSAFSIFTGIVYLGTIQFDWQQFLIHAGLVHNLADWSFDKVNPSFWSLAVECQFYLAYPIIRIGFRRLGSGGTILALAAISLLVRCAVWAIHGPFKFDLWWYNPLALWFDWVLGAHLAEKYLHGQCVFNRPLLSIVLSGSAFLGSTLFLPTAGVSFSLASLFAATLIDARLRVTPWAAWQRMELLLAPIGLISYSLYLLHQVLIDYILIAWRQLIPPYRHPSGVPGLVALPITFIIISGASYLLYRAVEVPCIRIGRRGTSEKFNGSRDRPTAEAAVAPATGDPESTE